MYHFRGGGVRLYNFFLPQKYLTIGTKTFDIHCPVQQTLDMLGSWQSPMKPVNAKLVFVEVRM